MLYLYMSSFDIYTGYSRADKPRSTGDGHLDAYVVVTRDGEPYEDHRSYLLFSDGAGGFRDSGQRFEFVHSTSAAAGDLDQDGDIDLLANEYHQILPYRNDGSGALLSLDWISNTDVTAGRLYLTVADLDANGTLDVFAAACCGGHTRESRPLYPFDMAFDLRPHLSAPSSINRVDIDC